MAKFGTSEDFVITSTGQLKILEETDEVCTTCDGSERGPTTFGVIRRSPSSVDLICTNCGSQKTVFPSQVQVRPSPEEQARRAALIAQATQRPAVPTPPAPAPSPEPPARKKPAAKKSAKKAPAGRGRAKR
jgi:hypothetical protein